MKDIQNQCDSRRINIRKVGIRGLSYPVIVLDKAHRGQKTVATVAMSVNLPHQFKGTHMSRFVEILNGFHERFTLSAYQRILEEMKERLDAGAAHLEMAFPYFFVPDQSGAKQLVRYECRLFGTLADRLELVAEVRVPVAVAPGGGAMAVVAVRMRQLFWIEDLIETVEAALTDPGGAFSVERASSAIAAALSATGALIWFRVQVTKQGLDHLAFAVREWPDPPEAVQPFHALSLFGAGPEMPDSDLNV